MSKYIEKLEEQVEKFVDEKEELLETIDSMKGQIDAVKCVLGILATHRKRCERTLDEKDKFPGTYRQKCITEIELINEIFMSCREEIAKLHDDSDWEELWKEGGVNVETL